MSAASIAATGYASAATAEAKATYKSANDIPAISYLFEMFTSMFDTAQKK